MVRENNRTNFLSSYIEIFNTINFNINFINMNKLFYIKSYADNLFYCFTLDWTLKKFHFLFINFWYIKKIGFSVTGFIDKNEAREFLCKKKEEFINAKRYIKL